MTSKGIIDILINIDSFRNIDLFYQGLYYIQFQVYQEINSEKIYSCPYDFQSDSDPIISMHSLVPPQIVESLSSYCTKVFMIKYSEEIVQIHETGIFRLETSLHSCPELLIQAELFFTDLKGDLSPESISKFIKGSSSAQPFAKAGSCYFKATNWKYGVNQFCPIVFHDTYSSVVRITMHTMLLDYRFRVDKAEITDYSQIEQCFFPLCSREVPDDNVDRVFKEYVLGLASCSNKVRQVLKKVLRSSGPGVRGKRLKHSIKPPLTFAAENCVSRYINTRNKKKITRLFVAEIKEVASLVCQMRFELGNVLKAYCSEVTCYLEEKYHEKVRALCMEHIYREVQIGELNIVSESHPSQSRTARAHRKSMHSDKRDNLEIFNIRVLSPEKLAVMFEEINIKSGELQENWKPKWFCNTKISAEKHLVVLVHGYMGSSYDMKTVKDVLLLYRSQLLVLVSESNEKFTEGSIQEMGMRLAEEISTYITGLPSPIIINKLSFIGHSLGGIIIRTALCYLSEYRKLMHLYISLGSPHLGCAQFSNKLVEAGLWILSKLRNSTCIQQLTFKDSLSPRSCFLYELAMKSRLNYFAQVVLVSSSQDAYVPYESARIEIGIGCQDMIQLEMADTVVGKIQQLHRVNVDFPIKAGLINNIHGRAAHISLLDNQSFLNALVYRFADSFSER